jgi:hypothetical protein
MHDFWDFDEHPTGVEDGELHPAAVTQRLDPALTWLEGVYDARSDLSVGNVCPKGMPGGSVRTVSNQCANSRASAGIILEQTTSGRETDYCTNRKDEEKAGRSLGGSPHLHPSEHAYPPRGWRW